MSFKWLTRTKVIIGAGIVVILGAVVFGISYVSLCRLMFVKSVLVHDEARRTKLNFAAITIRENLEKEYGAREVSFNSADGIHLAGLLIERKKAAYNVVICHGYRSDKEAVAFFVDMFDKANILLFDFRGHGKSQGELITIGCLEYQDVIAACEYLSMSVKSTVHPLPLVVIGLSMGGAAALKAAAINPALCDALIVDSSYADLWEVVNHTFSKYAGLPRFPFLPVMDRLFSYMTSCRLRDMCPLDFAKRVTCPIFFIHSCHDEHTPPSDTLRLYATVSHNRSKLWIGPKCPHADLGKLYSETYKRKVNVFLARFVFGTL